MNPDRSFEREFLKKSHSLRQRLTKSLLDETPQKKVRSRKKDQECKKNVVYPKDHSFVKVLKINPKFEYRVPYPVK
jgi:hypothetical protein